MHASSINEFITFSAHPDFFPIFQMPHFNSRGGHAFIAHQLGVGAMYERLALDNTPLFVLGARPCMALDNIDMFHHQPVLFPVNAEHPADFAAVFTGNHLDFIVFLDQTIIFFHKTAFSKSFEASITLPEPMR
jgi:hypothetical protein